MVKIAANIPDLHIPWHDKKSLDICLDIIMDVHKYSGIDEINLMGDVADFYGVNLHPKMPYQMNITQTIRDEIYEVIVFLKKLRSMFPKVKINFIEGNHETRLLRYITKKCPELFDLFTIPEIFKLNDLKINFIPYGRNQGYQCLGTNYKLRHSPYTYSESCSIGNIKKKFISLGHGCTHRRQQATLIDGDGVEVQSFSMGWLGDKDAEVFKYMDTDNWSQGFQVVYAFSKTEWIVDQIDIKNHKAIYNGHIYG